MSTRHGIFGNIRIIVFFLSIFIILGFVLHTSANPTIFGKYTIKYFLLLMVLVCSIPFSIYYGVPFFFKDHSTLHKKKVGTFVVILICVFALSEIYFRVNHKDVLPSLRTSPYILSLDNIHPFLQMQLAQSNNKDNPNLHIDSFGFRGEEITKDKPNNTYRIFVLGGSTVLNAGVPYEQNVVRILGKKLQAKYPDKQIQVLNAGVDGYTTEHSIIEYLFKISDFHPNLIIMWHGINDLGVSCKQPTSYGNYESDYSNYYGPIANIVFSYFQSKPLFEIHSAAIDAGYRFLQYNFYSDLVNYFKNKQTASIQTIPMRNFPSLESYKRNLTYFIKVTKADNVSIILANQPFLYDTKFLKSPHPDWFLQKQCRVGNKSIDLPSMIYGISQFNNAMQTIAGQNNIDFIDLAAHVPKTTEYFFDDVHYTVKGNATVAETLYSYITSHNMIQ